ncbi:MAG: endonuclease [Elusimicrobia bacterium]|nr:endonuclease [Elusimicrobiota bacterium]
MKRFTGLLSLAALSLVPFAFPSAQPAPALDILKGSSAGSLFSAPAPEAPLLFNPDRRVRGGLSGEALLSRLRAAAEPAPRARPSYKASKAFMYSKADNTGCNGGPGIITAYSRLCVSGSGDNGNSYREREDQNADGVAGDFVNAEHVWPQSYFKSALPMVADLHHLMSTLSTPNSRRANLKFARVSKPVYTTSSGSKLGKEGFEPDDSVKGNVARAMFYFVARYGDKNIRQGMDYESFWTENVPMLLDWNRQDPPDANERRRNDLVEGFQGNRNPFIDDPGLADRIGEAVFKAH